MPAYWIQISGATLLSTTDVAAGSYGESSEKKYGDIDDVQEVHGLVNRFSSTRLVDKYILDFVSSKPASKVAVVNPPIIYGSGQGPVNHRSVQIPELSRVTLQNKTGFQVGAGRSAWSNVHVSDLSQIFLLLVENATKGTDGALWDENGLYFAENGSLVSSACSKHSSA